MMDDKNNISIDLLASLDGKSGSNDEIVTEGFKNIKTSLFEIGQGLSMIASELSYPLDSILKLQKKILFRLADVLDTFDKQKQDMRNINQQLEKIRKNQQTIFKEIKDIKNDKQ